MIRAFTSEDLPFLDPLQPTGWSPLGPTFQTYLQHPFYQPIAYSEGGRLLGVANLTILGESAWLSHVIVHPDARRKGIGGALVAHLIEAADRSSVRTVSLIATEDGQPVYARLGFEPELPYLFFQGPEHRSTEANPEASGGTVRDSRIELISFAAGGGTVDSGGTAGGSDSATRGGGRPGDRNADIEAVLGIDAWVAGENRGLLLAPHLGQVWVYRGATQVEGFYLPSFREGLICARGPEAGTALLALKIAKNEKVVLPERNLHGIERLLASGYRESSRCWRMRRGPPLAWHPEGLYSRIAGKLG